MLKHFKNSKPFIVISMFVFIQIFSLPAQAVGTCLSDKSDISEDTKKINQKLAVKYGKSPIENVGKVAFVKDNVDEIYDEQEFKVDRSLIFLNQLNAIGVITDAPMASWAFYATAVLISPCHILTNAHAIQNEEARKGKVPVYVSLGQNSCEDGNEFSRPDMPGKVVAVGNFKFLKDNNPAAEDYAIIKINNISDIKPVVVSTDYITATVPLMMVGFPYHSTYTKKTGLRYPTTNFTRMKKFSIDGTFTTLNVLMRKGGSGSGLFVMGEDEQGNAKVFLAAIHESDGGVAIQTAEIVKRLAVSNPKVLAELTKAIEDGVCQ